MLTRRSDLFSHLPQLGDVPLEVDAAEEERVPRVDDLHDELRALEHPPQLAPHLEVLLERRQQHAVALLERREAAAPLEERGALVLVERLRRLPRDPRRPPRHRQVELLRLRRRRRRRLVHDARREDDDLAAPRGEVGAREGGRAHQLLEVAAVGDRAQLVLAALRLEHRLAAVLADARLVELLLHQRAPEVVAAAVRLAAAALLVARLLRRPVALRHACAPALPRELRRASPSALFACSCQRVDVSVASFLAAAERRALRSFCASTSARPSAISTARSAKISRSCSRSATDELADAFDVASAAGATHRVRRAARRPSAARAQHRPAAVAGRSSRAGASGPVAPFHRLQPNTDLRLAPAAPPPEAAFSLFAPPPPPSDCRRRRRVLRERRLRRDRPLLDAAHGSRRAAPPPRSAALRTRTSSRGRAHEAAVHAPYSEGRVAAPGAQHRRLARRRRRRLPAGSRRRPSASPTPPPARPSPRSSTRSGAWAC